MPSLSEMLSPEDLQKLIDAHNEAPYLSTPKEPSLPEGYSSIFNKPIAQDIVQQSSIPSKSAADSAKTFMEAPTSEAPTLMNEAPAAVSEATKKLAPEAASVSGEGLLGAAGKLASKMAIPLTAAYELLKSGPMGNESDAYADEHPIGKMIGGSGGNSGDRGSSSGDEGVRDTALGSRDSLFGSVSDKYKDLQKMGQIGEESPSSPAVASSPQEEKQKIIDLVNRVKSAQPRMNTSDAINSLLGKQSDQLKAAQDAANTSRLIAMLGQAGSTIGSAFTPLSKEKPNTEFFKNLEQSAGQPVQDVMTQQASEQAATKGALEKSQLQKVMNLQDPSSAESQSFRKAVETAYPNIRKVYGADWDNVSAADKDLVFEPIKLKEQMDMKREAAQQALQMKQMMFGKQANEKQSTAQNQTMSMLESARGNPEVSGALRNKLLVKNAASLINQYPDPNKMSPAEVSLLVTEIGKIASGGVPAEKELQTIMPNTMKSNLASMYSKLANNPQPAEAGAFIKKYQNYLKELDKNATDVVNDKYSRVLEGQKSRIGDDSYNNLKQNYTVKPIQFGSSGSHPQDSEAVAWAKANPTDPRSAAILSANGAQ